MKKDFLNMVELTINGADYRVWVSKYGHILKMTEGGKIYTPSVTVHRNKAGKPTRAVIGLCKDGKRTSVGVAELTYMAHGDMPITIDDLRTGGWSIHHIDGNPMNNNINNLMAIQQSEHIMLHRRQEENPTPNRRLYDISKSDLFHMHYTKRQTMAEILRKEPSFKGAHYSTLQQKYEKYGLPIMKRKELKALTDEAVEDMSWAMIGEPLRGETDTITLDGKKTPYRVACSRILKHIKVDTLPPACMTSKNITARKAS